MTQFYRNGFFRFSKLGNPHWVKGHDVSRETWDRSESSSTNPETIEYCAKRLREARAHWSATARYIEPNAECPVCSAPVYFYQNRHGSRVFFDELGPPWPKHECTDNGTYGIAQGQTAEGATAPPVPRKQDEVSAIEAWLRYVRRDPASEFAEKYNLDQWSAWQIEGSVRARRGRLLILRTVDSEQSRRLVVKLSSPTKALAPGMLVFYFKGWLSYFDLETMAGTDVEVQRLAGMRELLDELVAPAKRSDA